MKKTLRLTESDLIDLIGRLVKEQNEEVSSFEEYLIALDEIANDFNEDTNKEELEFIFDDMGYVLDSASQDDDISEEQLEELYEYANDLTRELESEFMSNRDLHEGTRAKKPRPMRSRRSGIKTQKRIDQNNAVLKKFKQ
jgi:hypothetical protein